MVSADPDHQPERMNQICSPTQCAAGLTATDLEYFRRHGWVIRRALCSPTTISRMIAEIDVLHEAMAAATADNDDNLTADGAQVAWEEGLASGRRRIRQLMHSERVSPLLDHASRCAEILTVMQQLIGPDVLLFHSKLMMKSAHDGSFTPWHQDFHYWQYESKAPTQVNCMLHLDAADAENGSLRFVDGSHKLGLLPVKHFSSKSFSIGLDGDLDAYPAATMITMAPGDAVFFGPLVIHGSGPNASARHRRANTFAFDKPGNRLEGELPTQNWRCGRAVHCLPPCISSGTSNTGSNKPHLMARTHGGSFSARLSP